MYLPFQILVYWVEIITNRICRSSMDNILEEQGNVVKMNEFHDKIKIWRVQKKPTLCI